MKTTLLLILTLMFMTLTLMSNSIAQVLSQKHLPEGAIARIGKGLASDVKYSPDGTLIAVGSQIGIWIYDAQTYQEIDLFTEHSESVEGVAFSPDGQTLAGANRGGTVKLWDVDTGRLKATFKGSGGWLMSVTFSPNGQTLACADADELKLWDVKTERLKATLKGHTNLIRSVTFSPDGRTLASGSRDKTVRLWDVDTKKLKSTLTDHKTAVRSVAYSPDGRTLAGGSWYGGGPSADNSICLWDAHTGRLKHTILGHSSGVVFSSDGRTLGSMGWGGAKLLDANTGQLKAHLPGISDFGGGVAFSPDGQTLAGVNFSMVKLWDVNTGRHKTDFTGHAGISPNIAFSPDGQTLAITDHERVRLWDANTGRHKTDLTGHAGASSYTHNSSTIAFSPDGQTLAGLKGGVVVLSDVNTGQQKTQLIGHTDRIGSVAFSRDGQTLATGSSTEVRLWDVSTGQQKTVLQDPDLRGHVIAYSPDGRTLATRSADGPDIRLWNTVTGEPLKVLTGHKNGARAMAFSPDSRTLVSGSYGELLLWDVVEGQQSGSLPTKGRCNASGLALSPDGSILVTEWSGTDIALWDIATGKQLATFSGHGNQHQHQITNLAFNPLNGNRVASASVDGTVLLWDVTPYVPQSYPVETDNLTEVPEVSVSDDVARVSLSPASVWLGTIGDQVTVNTNIAAGVDVRGYQIELTFDTAALRYVSSADGGYLSAGAFVVPSVVNGNRVTFWAASLQESSEGDGTLATFTFEVLTASPALPTLSDVKLTDSDANFLDVRIETGEVTDSPPLAGDVNGDGVVNLEDMTVAAGRLGQTGENTADMNKDGVVDVADLLLIAAAIEAAAAAPSLHPERIAEMFTATEVRQWVSIAQAQGLTGERYQRGFLLLEQLLLILTPKETLLLANYPNPFNPETWIPYQLSEPADVRISIYAADGRLVRMLTLGHQGAGIYESRGRAAYWDGRNVLGEPVASGVYFYTLTAGDFTATRKMLIRK